MHNFTMQWPLDCMQDLYSDVILSYTVISIVISLSCVSLIAIIKKLITLLLLHTHNEHYNYPLRDHHAV